MTRARLPLWLVAFLVGLMALSAAGDLAHADKKRIVLLPFSGPKAKRVRNAVIKELKKSARVVRYRGFTRSQRRLGEQDLGEESAVRAARRMGIHGVVIGEIRRSRRWYILSLTVRSSETGAIAAEFTVELGRKARLNSRVRRALRRELVPAIAELARVTDVDPDWQSPGRKPASDESNDELDDEFENGRDGASDEPESLALPEDTAAPSERSPTTPAMSSSAGPGGASGVVSAERTASS
ncbi:MAG: hypothetical protein AAGC55_04500, partial [Myxococcota bacterium]